MVATVLPVPGMPKRILGIELPVHAPAPFLRPAALAQILVGDAMAFFGWVEFLRHDPLGRKEGG